MEINRQLATVEKVISCDKHPNADRLNIVTVRGWQVITTEMYQPGDLCVYFEIDSFLPIHEEFEFLRKNCYRNVDGLGEGFRLRTVRLRGEISQGLALPLHAIKQTVLPIEGTFEQWVLQHYNDDLDVTEILGVKKFELSIPTQLAGQVRGSFPSYIPKTDQERIQNIWNKFGNSTDLIVREFTHPETGEVFKSEKHYDYFIDDRWEVTVKLDGSSMTVYFNNGDFGVCSRNMNLAETDDNTFWQVARRLRLKERMTNYGYNIALQGEMVGPGVQSNPLHLTEHHLFVFDIWDIDNQKYFDAHGRLAIINTLNNLMGVDTPDPDCIQSVPVINIGPLPFSTHEQALEYADGKTVLPDYIKRNNAWNSSKDIREGVVFKSIDHPEKSFKIISNKYLCSQND